MISVCYPFSADIPVGGGHPSAMLLMQGLNARGIRPILALHGPDGPAGRWLAEQGAGFRQVRFPHYAGGQSRNVLRDMRIVLSESRSLAAFLRREQVEIVHANDIWIMLTWALACKLAGVKLIWHHRSRARYKLPHRIAFMAADRMIAVSRFAAGRRAGDPKCEVIADPFEIEESRFDRATARGDLLAELGLEEPVQLLGFFANLNRPISWRKRPLVVIEALAELRALMPEQRFAALFFGTVNEAFRDQLLETARRLGVERQIFLMGFRTPPDPYLLAIDFVLAPAVDEGFGRVPIEAMLHGTPVIASNAGNHPELVRDGETGGLVPPDDPCALAGKIAALTRDTELRRRVIERARREAHARFGLAASARAVGAVYDQLLAGQPHRAAAPAETSAN